VAEDVVEAEALSQLDAFIKKYSEVYVEIAEYLSGAGPLCVDASS
jgi:hypothetical protein